MQALYCAKLFYTQKIKWILLTLNYRGGGGCEAHLKSFHGNYGNYYEFFLCVKSSQYCNLALLICTRQLILWMTFTKNITSSGNGRKLTFSVLQRCLLYKGGTIWSCLKEFLVAILKKRFKNNNISNKKLNCQTRNLQKIQTNYNL